MLISSPAAFVAYFEEVRGRTQRFIAHIPPEQVDFAPHAGKFSFGDLVRHLGATEAMFVRAVLEGDWAYPGHSRDLGPSLPAAVAYLNRQHTEAMARLRQAPDEVLRAKRPTQIGHPVSAWRLLMGMAEHETHHRSQIGQYLTALGLEPPQVFGLRVEQVPAAD